MTDDNNPQDLNNEAKNQQKFEQTIIEHEGKEISEETQKMVNTPYSNSQTALTEEDKTFLGILMEKIEKEDIKLHTPSSILNEEVYESLSGELQAKTDLFIQSILFVLRQIYDFYHSDHDNDSDMMINMVHELRLKKETLEKEIGDVLKI